MIMIQGSVKMPLGDGVFQPANTKTIAKFPNNHNFGFDIYNAENWKKYLHSYKEETGKLLPRKTKIGNYDIVYRVYVYGISREMRPHLVNGVKNGLYNLFPGRDSNGISYRVIDRGYID